MGNNAGLDTGQLPERIGLFPLDGVLLLPGGRLPLQVYEPRYRNLVNDAMGTEQRLIGMIQPTQDATDNQLHKVGCAGRITSYTELSDEMYMIILTGCCRFRVEKELKQHHGYRIAKCDWSRFLGDVDSGTSKRTPIDRDMIKKHLKEYLDKKGLSADWEVFGKVPDDELVTALAMICPFTPNEKQHLLETKTQDKLTERLINLLRIGGANITSSTSTLH